MDEEADRRRTEGEGRQSVIDVRLKGSQERASDTTLHYLPFLIDYEGPAPSIRNYFVVENDKQRREIEDGSTSTTSSSSTSTSSDDDEVLRTSVRGRLLRGKALQLPDDYQGVVLREGFGRTADDALQWDVSGQFKSFTYWNHDSRPHASDLPQQWMKWLQLSRQIHATIDEADVAQE